ncbi:MAG: hypothetical protein V3U35_05450 [Candidatus Neomarinimicrobiota bacterium]
MKPTLLTAGLVVLLLLVLFAAGQALLLASLAWQLHPAAGWLVGLSLAALLLLGSGLAAILLLAAAEPTSPAEKGSRRHQRYVAGLARRLRRDQPAITEGQSEDDVTLARASYERLEEPTNARIQAAAEAVFFHTAISQSGQLDRLVVAGVQLRLVGQLARSYHPGIGARALLGAYLGVLRAGLTPGEREETDPGGQIGPAIVGASVVGAIPGANLVSIIIADAVIQGSANALAVFRTGLLTRLYFQHRLEGDTFEPAAARKRSNRDAQPMLSALVSEASGALSRAIWEAAKESLRRLPAATYDSLKSLVGRSVQGLGRKKAGSAKEPEQSAKAKLPHDD